MVKRQIKLHANMFLLKMLCNINKAIEFQKNRYNDSSNIRVYYCTQLHVLQKMILVMFTIQLNVLLMLFIYIIEFKI